jgi:sensor histidine kinase YesM
VGKLTQSDLFQHLAFWVLYLIVVAAGDLVYYPDFLSNLRTNFIMTLPMAGLVYLNLFVLIPLMLMRRKAVLYWLSVVVLLGVCVGLKALVTYSLFHFVYENANKAGFFISQQGITVLTIQACLLFFITMALFFLKQWYVKEKYTRELEEKNLRSELELLKHQIQPHFFFNTLNTVYMLMEKDVELSRKALLQFSDILSHQLYDSNKGRVLLEKEMEYLENYIEIQRLRHSDLLELRYEMEPHPGPFLIAPMLLVVFVENAFKHSQSPNGYRVSISSGMRDGKLYFRVWNSIDAIVKPARHTQGGIGLANVERRLALLYPGRSVLSIDRGDNFFEVQLEIELERVGEKSQPVSSRSRLWGQMAGRRETIGPATPGPVEA